MLIRMETLFDGFYFDNLNNSSFLLSLTKLLLFAMLIILYNTKIDTKSKVMLCFWTKYRIFTAYIVGDWLT